MAEKGCAENGEDEQQDILQIETQKAIAGLQEVNSSGNTSDQQGMNRKADHARNFVPIGRNQRNDAEADSQSAQTDQRPQTQGTRPVRLIFPDAQRRRGVNQTGFQPNI